MRHLLCREAEDHEFRADSFDMCEQGPLDYCGSVNLDGLSAISP